MKVRILGRWFVAATILALNVDDLDKQAGDRDAVEAVLKQMNFPFATGWATESLLQRLNTFQQAMLDRWQPLPVPSSFLIDRSGRVVAIYKGPLGVKQLLDDVKLLSATPEQRRTAGLPFAGKWLTETPTAEPLRISARFVDSDDVPAAIDYLRRYCELVGDERTDRARSRQLGDVFYVLAILLSSDQTRHAEALSTFAKAADRSGDDFRIRSDWGELLLKKKRYAEAVVQFRHALRIKPGDGRTLHRLIGALIATRNFKEAARYLSWMARELPNNAHIQFQLGEVYREDGDTRRAVEQFRAALKISPKLHAAANNLAWILATHPDSQIRNGTEAVRVAERMCGAQTPPPPVMLGTLSAAYAEAGRFDEAVQAIDRGIAAAEKAGDEALARQLRVRRKLYAQKKPFRDVVKPNRQRPVQ